jgi:C1A family cysteine protease
LVVVSVLLFVHSINGGAGISTENMEQFKLWANDHGHTYKDESEIIKRAVIFLDNFESIKQHNSNPNRTYNQALNYYSDRTLEEFIKARATNAGNTKGTIQPAANIHTSDKATMSPVPNFDWRQHNGVTPVKNQYQTNSCWTFSTIASIESAYIRSSGQELNLSEQQLIDCSPRGDGLGLLNLFDDGTGPGMYETAFDYAKTHAIATETNYPFIQKKGTCNKNVQGAVKVLSHEETGSGIFSTEKSNYQNIINLINKGVGSTYIYAGSELQNYHSGIITSCGAGMINHEINIVGYGNENGINYWICRNSWGQNWGENGYFRIAMGYSMCAIGWRVGVPTVTKA